MCSAAVKNIRTGVSRSISQRGAPRGAIQRNSNEKGPDASPAVVLRNIVLDRLFVRGRSARVERDPCGPDGPHGYGPRPFPPGNAGRAYEYESRGRRPRTD